MTLKTLLLTGLAALAISANAQTLNRFQVGTAATTANSNNWPSAEAPANVLDSNPATKYLNFGKLNTGFLLTYASPVIANGINFSTANDAMERDPASFSLYGSTTVTASTAPGSTFNLSDFTLIVDTQALSLPTTRLTAVGNTAINNTNAYQTYLVVFPTVRTAGSANSMQIGDAVLTNGGTVIPTAGSTIAGGQLIPEPSSVCLLGLAVAGAAGIRRKR